MTNELLRADGITVRFGGVVACADINLMVGERSFVGLIGPNGAGKTTLLDALTGFVRPAAGTVHLDGRRIDRLSPTARARAGLVRSFQGVALFEDLTVRENVRVAAATPRWNDVLLDCIHPRRSLAHDHVDWAMDLVGITRHADDHASSLPTGTRNLVGVARALATRTKVLLLDEPAAGLDSNETQHLADRIGALPGLGVSVLLIDHDVDLVLRLSDRVYALDFGRVVAEGTPDVVRADHHVIDAYLGGTS